MSIAQFFKVSKLIKIKVRPLPLKVWVIIRVDKKMSKKCRKMSKIFFNSDVWFYEWFPIEGGGSLTPHPFLLIGIIIYNIWYVLETSTSKIWKNGKFAKKNKYLLRNLVIKQKLVQIAQIIYFWKALDRENLNVQNHLQNFFNLNVRVFKKNWKCTNSLCAKICAKVHCKNC